MSSSISADSTWNDAKWQRYGLLSGVVFVVLNVVGVIAGGVPPSRDASAEKISKYFVDKAGGIKLGAIVFAIGLIFGLWWIGSLWRVIGRLEPDGPRLALIVVLGFAVSAAVAAVGQALFAGPALRLDTLGGTTELMWSVGFVAYSMVMAVTAAQMLALAALVMRTKFLPVWMGWLALASAVVCAVATIGAGSEANAFLVLQTLGFVSWMLWVLISSVLLYMRKEA